MPLVLSPTIRRTIAIPAIMFAVVASQGGVRAQAADRAGGVRAAAYLGFDANDYPGDDALPFLKHTFSFIGFWLNEPPGGTSVAWFGKRGILRRNGFGFLVLFNGRVERELKTAERAVHLGSSDAHAATQAAAREGFPTGAVIFLDQEEGGEMEPDQLAYLLAWVDGILAAGYRAGVYCSGIAASAGEKRLVVTAQDIRDHAGGRAIEFFIYNDACPPSPGCAAWKRPPAPSRSGVPFASVWQFAQSPRRRQFTARCKSTYDDNGNCYPPGVGPSSTALDLDAATSADPSRGR